MGKAQDDLKKKNAEIRNLKDELEEQVQGGQKQRNELDKELESTRTALALARQEIAEMKDKSESTSMTFFQELADKSETTSLTFSQDIPSFMVESCVESVVEYEESIDIMVTETEVARIE